MVGQIAENFILKDEDGNTFELYQNLDKKVLLVFYPKDNSPVCTRQLSDYTRNREKFSHIGIKIIAINPDSAEKHKNFCRTADLNFPILVDEGKVVCKKYNALDFMEGARRKLVLIGTDKKIIFEKNIFPLFYLDSGQIFEALTELNLIP